MKTKTYNQISDITSNLVGANLSTQQNYPSEKNGVIYVSDKVNLSLALKDIPYDEIYKLLDEEKNYNIKMIDGALLQFMYTFDGDNLKKYRLAFFPSPNLEEFQNNPEIYEDDEIYADVLMKNIVPTPIRFDYDPDNHINLTHPMSHLTIGQYKNCRIPICAPITPNAFIDFILRNFYNTAHRQFCDTLNFDMTVKFDSSITEDEKKVLHLFAL